MNRPHRLLTLFLLRYVLPLLVLAACAGYRGGWESVAYVGPTPPAQSVNAGGDAPAALRHPLVLPGLQLEVSLDNKLRTHDNQVYLIALPLSVDPRKVYPQNNEPGKTRVFVTVTSSEPGFVFRPALASLRIADQQFSGIAGFEFGMWNGDGKQVSTGGTWDHRPVGPEFILGEPGRKYYLSIDFATPVPSPESREIAIDLSGALVPSHHPVLPLIRFLPVR